MITLKKGHYIDETQLNKEEAKLFIDFLTDERNRHAQEMYRCKEEAFKDVHPFLSIVYYSAVTRHLDDIQHIDRTIVYLQEKYK